LIQLNWHIIGLAARFDGGERRFVDADQLSPVSCRLTLQAVPWYSGRKESFMLPHTFKRIILHLARSREFPEGSTRHGYEFVAPLDIKGHIDPALWRQHREHCRVRRFWNGEGAQLGRLVHKRAARSMPGSSSTTIRTQPMMMSPDIGSVCTPSRRANTSRSAMMRASFIPFAWWP
jgi:hypothetical protein